MISFPSRDINSVNGQRFERISEQKRVKGWSGHRCVVKELAVHMIFTAQATASIALSYQILTHQSCLPQREFILVYRILHFLKSKFSFNMATRISENLRSYLRIQFIFNKLATQYSVSLDF